MIGYLAEFGMAKISYLEWMKYAYPMLLLEIPITSAVLWFTFTPSQKVMDSSVRKLKVQVAKNGKMTLDQLLAIIIFIAVFFRLGFFKSLYRPWYCCFVWCFPLFVVSCG